MDARLIRCLGFLGLACCVVPSTLFALQSDFGLEDWSPVLSFSIAPAIATSSGSQTIQLQEDVTKTYTATNDNSAFARFEVFLGGETELSENTLLQLGIAANFGQGAPLKGSILEDTNPDFNNYYYTYDVNNTAVGLKGKFLYNAWSDWFPYLSARVSFASNRAYNYDITPKIVEEVPAPLFSPYRTSTVSYAIGIGIDKEIKANWRLGIGYEYANLGKSELAAAPGQTLNRGLSLSRLNTQSIQFGINYIC